MSPEALLAFEEDIAAEFNAGRIRAPVHLYSGCEEQMIDVFKSVKPEDWVCCSWRSHYQCLLKGVPPEKLKAAIMAGHSISLCFPEHRVISSAIVGGILPISVGLAMGLKRSGAPGRVHTFMGDMTSHTGMAAECITYAGNHGLPMRFIVEDNDLSVCTPTGQVWGREQTGVEITRFFYKSKWPHAGAGVRVQF